MSTGFIATTIVRVARKRIVPYYFFLAGILISTCGFLGFLQLLKSDTIPYLVITLGALFICGMIVRSMRMLNRAIKNPLESYFVNNLKRYGPLEKSIVQIDSEAAPYIGTTGSFVTKHWIISAQSSSLSFTRLEDVVWVYKQVSKGRVTFYFVVTVSSWETHAATIWDRWGSCTTILSSNEGVDRLLETIANNAPWISKGYMEQLASAWNRKRADFIAAVDKRRSLLTGEKVDTDGGNEKGVASQPSHVLLPANTNLPIEHAPNHSLLRVGLQDDSKKGDRSARWKGVLILFVGLLGSALFIFPFAYGILHNENRLSYSNNGIVITLMTLIYGTYHIVFGYKGKRLLEKVYRKSF
jgi:hypothetical protein